MIKVAKHGKLTQNEFDDLSKSFALDLVAVFSLIQEDVMKLLDKSIKEGWSADVLIKKVEDLI